MFKSKDKNIEKPIEESPESLAGREEEEYKESQKSPERDELVKTDRTNEEIRKELEGMDLDETSEMEAQIKANGFESLETKEKINKLLQTAKSKGVVFAVNVAKKMNDHYVLDTFHDVLAKEGYYKKFVK